jgi:hypothetical protein
MRISSWIKGFLVAEEEESNLGNSLEERNLHKYVKKKFSSTSLRLRRHGGGACIELLVKNGSGKRKGKKKLDL